MMLTEYSDFYNWVWDSMYAPHGPVHTWIGGVLNCDDTVATVTSLVGADNADALALYAFDQRKNFWRDGFFACEGLATNGQTEDDVRMQEGERMAGGGGVEGRERSTEGGTTACGD